MSDFDDLLAAFLKLLRDSEFDPGQKRNDSGEWTDEGGGSGKRKKAKPQDAKSKPAGKTDTQPITGKSIPEEG